MKTGPQNKQLVANSGLPVLECFILHLSSANDWMQHSQLNASRVRDDRQILRRRTTLGGSFQGQKTIRGEKPRTFSGKCYPSLFWALNQHVALCQLSQKLSKQRKSDCFQFWY